jgi:phosphonoacetate hydrolase
MISNQRIVIGMLDGFGLEYYDKTELPVTKDMARHGLFKRSRCVFPSVTNVNNVSIATGAWPVEHGINANSYFDQSAGEARYMNSAELIKSDTVFKRARRYGVKSALITAKRKSVELFKKDADIAVTAEDPPQDYIDRFGRPANIYSPEINYWLWEVANGILETARDISVIYVHTTDYPMHAWAPEAPESVEHLQELDRRIAKAQETAPDAAFFLTADHSMNAKTRCWDLTRVCEQAGTPIRFALSPERDYYVRHHRNFTGCAWIWLHKANDYDQVAATISRLEGVEGILTRREMAGRFHLDPLYVGDINVMGDKETMFGDMDQAYEKLASDYRAHGSLYEMEVPLIIQNYKGDLPEPSFFQANKDIAGFLFKN